MDGKTNSTTPRRIHMDFDHAAQWPFRILVTDSDTGEGIAHACTFTDGSRLFDEALNYALMLDAAGEPPVDIPDEPDDAPPGGDEPPDIWYALTSEQRQEIDLLYRCHLGQHVRDWAGVDALAAFVGRGLRDRWHPMLGERVRALPSGDVGTLLAVDEHGYLLVDGTARTCLPRSRVERLTFDLAASPTPPVAPPLQPAPAGGDAASAAGPCDVSGCAAPGSTVWLGRWPAYPARLCGAHRKAVA